MTFRDKVQVLTFDVQSRCGERFPAEVEGC